MLAPGGNVSPSCPRNTTSQGGGVVRDVLESLTRSYMESGDLTRARETYQKLVRVGHLQNVLLVRQVGQEMKDTESDRFVLLGLIWPGGRGTTLRRLEPLSVIF